MILHDDATDSEAVRNLLVEKNARVETAPLDESGIKKLVYCNSDGLILLGEPTQTMLVLLREMLGRRLLPESFPVFYNSETMLLIANNHGLGSLNIINSFEPDNCLNIATQYQSKKAKTGSFLGWATVALMFVLLFLGLKGAKVFLPAGELETQVEKLKNNDRSFLKIVDIKKPTRQNFVAPETGKAWIKPPAIPCECRCWPSAHRGCLGTRWHRGP
jgi:hypothetical protein